jgi:tetratricopeptide (TPR) repeat protein
VHQDERQLTEALRLQNDVARAIADELRVQLTPEEQTRMAGHKSVNPEAHQEYLVGRYHLFKHNEEDLKRSIEHFNRAIEIDPDYAAAFAALSHAWWARGIFGNVSLKEVEFPVRIAARKALELDDQLAEAYVVQSDVKQIYEWDWKGAKDDALRALELNPNSADAHFTYALLLQSIGRLPEAIDHIQTAVALDPLAPALQANFGRILYRARRYGEAILHLNRTIDLDPLNYGAYARLSAVYLQLGELAKADESHRKFLELRVSRTPPRKTSLTGPASSLSNNPQVTNVFEAGHHFSFVRAAKNHSSRTRRMAFSTSTIRLAGILPAGPVVGWNLAGSNERI